jgi:hypothetical protein
VFNFQLVARCLSWYVGEREMKERHAAACRLVCTRGRRSLRLARPSDAMHNPFTHLPSMNHFAEQIDHLPSSMAARQQPAAHTSTPPSYLQLVNTQINALQQAIQLGANLSWHSRLLRNVPIEALQVIAHTSVRRAVPANGGQQRQTLARLYFAKDQQFSQGIACHMQHTHPSRMGRAPEAQARPLSCPAGDQQ